MALRIWKLQRFTAAITGLFAVPASQAAERLTEGQPTAAVQGAKHAETQGGRARPKAEVQTISYSNEFPRHPKSSEIGCAHTHSAGAESRRSRASGMDCSIGVEIAGRGLFHGAIGARRPGTVAGVVLPDIRISRTSCRCHIGDDRL